MRICTYSTIRSRCEVATVSARCRSCEPSARWDGDVRTHESQTRTGRCAARVGRRLRLLSNCPTRSFFSRIPGLGEIELMGQTAHRLRQVVDQVKPDVLHAHSPVLRRCAVWPINSISPNPGIREKNERVGTVRKKSKPSTDSCRSLFGTREFERLPIPSRAGSQDRQRAETVAGSNGRGCKCQMRISRNRTNQTHADQAL